MSQEASLRRRGESAPRALGYCRGTGTRSHLVRVLFPHMDLVAVGLDGSVGTVLALVGLHAAVAHAVTAQGVVIPRLIFALTAGVGLRPRVRPEVKAERLAGECRVAALTAPPRFELLVDPLLVVVHLALRVECLATNVAEVAAGATPRLILRAAAQATLALHTTQLLRIRWPMTDPDVLRQMALGLVGAAADRAEKGPHLRVGEPVLLHDGGGEAAVVAHVAGDELQVLAVLPPQVEATLLPRGKLLAALGALVFVWPAV